jgi:hypothetical protein
MLHGAAIGTEVAAEGSLACDAVSTHELLAHHPNDVEVDDSALGQRPGIAREFEYFGGVGLALAGFNQAFAVGYDHRPLRERVIADAWRTVANLVMLGVELGAVQNNRVLGPTCGL